MMENLHVDFTKTPFSNRARHQPDDFSRMASTQPVTSARAPATDVDFAWERPHHHMFASQPTEAQQQEFDSQTLWASLAEDPTMSQFAPQPHLSVSLVCTPPAVDPRAV